MNIEVSGFSEKEGFLTEEELEVGRIYFSNKRGSKGFYFVKLGDEYNKPRTIAFSENTCLYPAGGHERDFYLAPPGTQILIKN